MIDVYSCKHYLFFLQQFIENQNKENGRGITKRIAMALQCHSTFISQVLKNKSHFSVEQAIRFCKFAKLDSSETEFFLNLLMHAKSSDIDTKEFYSLLLKKQISERQDLTRRWKKWNLKSPEVESLYFGSVLLQLVHAATQIQGKNDFRSISKRLHVTEEQVASALSTLLDLSLVEKQEGSFKSTENFMHLSKKSATIRTFHTLWRQQAISHFLHNDISKGSHYSGVLTFSKEQVAPLKDEVYLFLDRIMSLVRSSDSEVAYVLNLDFFPTLTLEES